MFKIPQDIYCTNPWSEQWKPSKGPNIFCTNYNDLIVTSMECWELDLGNHPQMAAVFSYVQVCELF
jgi:hypothetical protein